MQYEKMNDRTLSKSLIMTEMEAKDLIEDVFIYLPKEDKFIFVNFVEILNNTVSVISETITGEGLRAKIKKFKKTDKVIVVSQYNIKQKDFIF